MLVVFKVTSSKYFSFLASSNSLITSLIISVCSKDEENSSSLLYAPRNHARTCYYRHIVQLYSPEILDFPFYKAPSEGITYPSFSIELIRWPSYVLHYTYPALKIYTSEFYNFCNTNRSLYSQLTLSYKIYQLYHLRTPRSPKPKLSTEHVHLIDAWTHIKRFIDAKRFAEDPFQDLVWSKYRMNSCLTK